MSVQLFICYVCRERVQEYLVGVYNCSSVMFVEGVYNIFGWSVQLFICYVCRRRVQEYLVEVYNCLIFMFVEGVYKSIWYECTTVHLLCL